MELLEGDMIFFFFLFSAYSAYEVSYLKANLLKLLRNLRKPNLLVCKQRGLSMLLPSDTQEPRRVRAAVSRI